MEEHAVKLIKCPEGGFHDYEPVWEWNRNIQDFECYEIRCTKCGEQEGEKV